MELALETIRVLRRFKNAVLEGPPGTGKSHVVAAIAASWLGATGRPLRGNGRGRYAITLHPNSTYEEFVEGLRYDDTTSSFVRRDGFLREVIKDALADPTSDYLVLIDELNRANVPKVFGDLLLTMESSKRTTWDGTAWVGGTEITLPYSGSLFSVPSNIYLLGTMNTSDRSIAPLDSALRRRFGFIRVEPLVGADLRNEIRRVEGPEAVSRVTRSIDELTNLNEALRKCLGPDALLGHSYLFDVRATQGAVADVNDPLSVLREAANRTSATAVFWVEARSMDGGSHNQLNLPDDKPPRKGIVDAFFPMASGGSVTPIRSTAGTYDKVDILFDGELYKENVVRFNADGPNYKLYYTGKTDAGEKFSKVGGTRLLEQKIHVWLRLPDDTLELLLFDRSDVAIAALSSVSSPPGGWHEISTATASGRAYGEIDLDLLSSSGGTARSDDADAEWMVWRYAVLPQLIDSVTQVGATELLSTTTRTAWLEAAGAADVADRWAKFDEFLSTLSLAIREEGYGLTRGLSVVEIPVGAASEYVAIVTENDLSPNTIDDAANDDQ